MSGVKNDQEKPQMALLSPFALEEIAKVMTFGAKKYSENNWRNGFKYTRLLSAVMRHLNAYQKGEALDPETGLSHLAHASCGLLMLLEFEQTGAGENDIYWQNKAKEPQQTERAVQKYIVTSTGTLPIERIDNGWIYCTNGAMFLTSDATVIDDSGQLEYLLP